MRLQVRYDRTAACNAAFICFILFFAAQQDIACATQTEEVGSILEWTRHRSHPRHHMIQLDGIFDSEQTTEHLPNTDSVKAWFTPSSSSLPSSDGDVEAPYGTIPASVSSSSDAAEEEASSTSFMQQRTHHSPSSSTHSSASHSHSSASTPASTTPSTPGHSSSMRGRSSLQTTSKVSSEADPSSSSSPPSSSDPPSSSGTMAGGVKKGGDEQSVVQKIEHYLSEALHKSAPYLSFVTILVFGFCLLLVRHLLLTRVAKDFKPLLQNIIKELALLVGCSVAALLLAQLDPFFTFLQNKLDLADVDSARQSIKEFGLCLALTAVVLVFLHLILLWEAHRARSNWQKKQTQATDPTLRSRFDDAESKARRSSGFFLATSLPAQVYSKIYKVAQFAALRNAFINPSKPVLVTPVKLSKNFDFALYLTKGLNVTLLGVSSLSPVSFFLLVSAVAAAITLAPLSEQSTGIACVSALIFCWLCCVVLVTKLNWVYRQLVPTSKNYESSALPTNDDEVMRPLLTAKPELDPTEGMPPYLLQDFSIYSRFSALLLCKSSLNPNKHQQLFWFDARGPRFLVSCLRFVLLLEAAALSVLVVEPSTVLAREFNFLHAVVFWTLLGVSFCGIHLTLRQILPLLTVTTYVELMRDDDLVHETVGDQEVEQRLRTWRFLQSVKSKTREINRIEGFRRSDRPPLHLDKVDQISQVFKLYDVEKSASQKSGVVHKKHLHSLLASLGKDIDLNEYLAFLREMGVDKSSEQTIHFVNFCEVVEDRQNDADADSRDVVRRLLDVFDRDRVGRIPLKDFKAMLVKLGLSQSDVHGLSQDATFSEDGLVDLDDFSMFVKHILVHGPL